MNPSTLIRLAAVAALSVAASAASAAPVGARVLAQQWDPTRPDVQPVSVLADDPDVVSRSLAQAWTQARPQICNALRARLSTPGLVKGQSLYDIDCRLPADAVLTLLPSAANVMEARLSLAGSSVTATSTVPDPLPREVDPRFSVTLDATLAVRLAVQADPNVPLRATSATFALSNARIDSHNASGDVLKFVADDLVPFFGGPNFKQMAESAINGVSVNLANTFNAAIAPVNAALRTPSNLVRVGLWARPDRITVAFAPRELPPTGGGTVAGTVRWDGTQYRPADCGAFQLQASVQTGPAPLMNPDNHAVVGVAPRRNVGTASLAPAGEGACRYTIANLPPGWPARIDTKVQGATRLKTGGNTFFTSQAGLLPVNWSGTVAATVADRDFKLAEGVRANAVPQRQQAARDLLGPVAKPLRPGVDVERRALNPQLQPRVSTAPQVNSDVALNPQPLPPRVTQRLSRDSAVLERRGLNPQPLPPREAQVSIGSDVALNPQPLPPRTIEPRVIQPRTLQPVTPQSVTAPSSVLDRQGLNPQTLPPKDRLPAIRSVLDRQGMQP
jgi:hypothetical protein